MATHDDEVDIHPGSLRRCTLIFGRRVGEFLSDMRVPKADDNLSIFSRTVDESALFVLTTVCSTVGSSPP